MSGQSLHELQPIDIQGDIPWNSVAEKVAMPDIFWMAPQRDLAAVGEYEREMRKLGLPSEPEEITRLTQARKMTLERVTLSNGIRYVVIKDAQTGIETYEPDEYAGLIRNGIGEDSYVPYLRPAQILENADMGMGYHLQTIMARKPTTEKRAISLSFVEKIFDAKEVNSPFPNTHCLHYQVDPKSRVFTGRYDFNSDVETTTLWMNTYLISPDGHEFNRKLTFTVKIREKRTDNQIEFSFQSDGTLEKITLAGIELLGIKRAVPEFLALTEASQKGLITLSGAELQSPAARNIIEKLLGVTFDDELILNTKDSLTRLIANADSSDHRNPRQVLCFRNAANISPSFKLHASSE